MKRASARHRYNWFAGIALLALCLASVAMAGSVRSGEVTIYYNALSGNDLPKASTDAYGLRHAADQGIVIIAASRGNGSNAINVPVTVTGTATTLLGRKIRLRFHAINENGELSTLATFDIGDHETVNFEITVTTADRATTPLHFTHAYPGSSD